MKLKKIFHSPYNRGIETGMYDNRMYARRWNSAMKKKKFIIMIRKQSRNGYGND